MRAIGFLLVGVTTLAGCTSMNHNQGSNHASDSSQVPHTQTKYDNPKYQNEITRLPESIEKALEDLTKIDGISLVVILDKHGVPMVVGSSTTKSSKVYKDGADIPAASFVAGSQNKVNIVDYKKNPHCSAIGLVSSYHNFGGVTVEICH